MNLETSKHLAPALALALLPLACETPAKTPAPGQTPRVFAVSGAGRIYLGAPDWRAVEALAVSDGRVLEAGSRDEVLYALRGRSIDLVELGESYAVPGLQDAHGHLEGLGTALEEVDLRGCRSYEELIERVAARAADLPARSWIEGRGWDQNLWPGKAFPHHRALSERVPEHPVLVRRVDGHAAFANRRALAIAGLDGPQEGEHPVPGGRMLLDAEGRPSGVFVDAAMGLVSRHIPPPDRATRVRRLLLAQQALFAVGLTAVHDMGVGVSTIEILRELRDSGRWKLRAIEYLAGNPGVDGERFRGFPLAPDERDVLSVVGVKLMIDGALGSRGAALLEDYEDDPGHSGLLLIDVEQLEQRVDACAELGLQPAVHAIGDRGNRVVLDAFARTLASDPDFAALRPRIEHAQIVSAADWSRFARLGVVPSMQPTHCTSDMPWVPDRIGPSRVDGAYAWRRLAPDLGVLAFGSDFPVEKPDPLEGLYAAITRQARSGRPPGGWAPDQRLTAAEALTGFTWGAARAVRQEDRRGRLAPGYFCDLTVIDVDPLECDPEDLLGARVVRTVINGEVVFGR